MKNKPGTGAEGRPAHVSIAALCCSWRLRRPAHEQATNSENDEKSRDEAQEDQADTELCQGSVLAPTVDKAIHDSLSVLYA